MCRSFACTIRPEYRFDGPTLERDRLARTADYHATVPTGNLLQQTVSVGLSYTF
jgi:hypothetical protein